MTWSSRGRFMPPLLFSNATVVLEDRIVSDGQVEIQDSKIATVGQAQGSTSVMGTRIIDLRGNYLAPGFIDLHVHGGAGADFMDGSEEAFRTVCRAHARHGTTSLLPTTTVARHEQHLEFLKDCRRLKREGTGGCSNVGAIFYSTLFAP